MNFHSASQTIDVHIKTPGNASHMSIPVYWTCMCRYEQVVYFTWNLQNDRDGRYENRKGMCFKTKMY